MDNGHVYHTYKLYYTSSCHSQSKLTSQVKKVKHPYNFNEFVLIMRVKLQVASPFMIKAT